MRSLRTTSFIPIDEGTRFSHWFSLRRRPKLRSRVARYLARNFRKPPMANPPVVVPAAHGRSLERRIAFRYLFRLYLQYLNHTMEATEAERDRLAAPDPLGLPTGTLEARSPSDGIRGCPSCGRVPLNGSLDGRPARVRSRLCRRVCGLPSTGTSDLMRRSSKTSYSSSRTLSLSMLTENDLVGLVRELGRIYGPLVVGVFGSYAIGAARDDSDLDLFIIKECPEPPSLRRCHVQQILSGLLYVWMCTCSRRPSFRARSTSTYRLPGLSRDRLGSTTTQRMRCRGFLL